MKKMIKSAVLLLSSLGLVACSFGPGADQVVLSKAEYDKYLEDKKVLDKLDYLESNIKKEFLFDYDEKAFEDGIYKGLFESLNDPYSVYYNEEEYKKILEDTSGEFGGIGVVITAAENEFITVVSPIKGTPGEKAGIVSGDKIIKINDEYFMAKDLEKAVDTMRGEPGTMVNVTIRRDQKDGSSEDIDLELTREIIKVETIYHEKLDGGYDYVRISSFDEHTAKDFINTVKELENNSSKGMVIDLRNNPGGLLTAVVDMADFILPNGPIVSTLDKENHKEVVNSDENMSKLPLVVLINQGSASASEILSGAIKDYGRGKLVGEKTFGKGIVQRIFPLKDGGGYKMTVSEYLSPRGNKIHKLGVEPDIEVKLTDGQKFIGIENLEFDDQLKKAIEVLKEETNGQ